MRCSGGCVGVGCVYVQVRSIVLIVLKHCALHLPASVLTRSPAVSHLAIAGADQLNTVPTAPRFASTSAGSSTTSKTPRKESLRLGNLASPDERSRIDRLHLGNGGNRCSLSTRSFRLCMPMRIRRQNRMGGSLPPRFRLQLIKGGTQRRHQRCGCLWIY